MPRLRALRLHRRVGWYPCARNLAQLRNEPMTKPRAWIGAIATTAALLTACGDNIAGTPVAAAPASVTPTSLNTVLLGADQISGIMGASNMTAERPFTQLQDNRLRLPNLNCLGILSVAETAIYEKSGLTAVRGQALREPDGGDWQHLAVQAVITYPSADAAQKFFSESADRWAKCQQHTSNITINAGPTTSWFFAKLDRTATRLTMPVSVNNGQRKCQRDLSVFSNVVIDVKACGPAITDQGANIADQIQGRLPR